LTSDERVVRELYEQHGGDVGRVAQHLGLGVYAPPPVNYSRRRTPPADVGKATLRKFMVSVRHVDSPLWPSEDEGKIEQARSDYEAGSHEMCQGRDLRGWFCLYSIPRKKRAGARKFFVTEG
jgi:hypothetical protein